MTHKPLIYPHIKPNRTHAAKRKEFPYETRSKETQIYNHLVEFPKDQNGKKTKPKTKTKLRFPITM